MVGSATSVICVCVGGTPVNRKGTPPGGGGNGPVRPRPPFVVPSRPVGSSTRGSYVRPRQNLIPEPTPPTPPAGRNQRSHIQANGSVQPNGSHGAPLPVSPHRHSAAVPGPKAGPSVPTGHTPPTVRTRFPLDPQTRSSAPSPQPRPIGGASYPTEAEQPIRSEPMSGLLGTGTKRPLSGQRNAVPPGTAPSRAQIDAGDPCPPISGRPQDGVGTSAMDQKRIASRSPRAALEPKHVNVPTRRSRRTRNPLVIVGNAIFTLLILLAIAGGVAFAVGKTRFEAPGPLDQEKMVNIPPR